MNKTFKTFFRTFWFLGLALAFPSCDDVAELFNKREVDLMNKGNYVPRTFYCGPKGTDGWGATGKLYPLKAGTDDYLARAVRRALKPGDNGVSLTSLSHESYLLDNISTLFPPAYVVTYITKDYYFQLLKGTFDGSLKEFIRANRKKFEDTAFVLEIFGQLVERVRELHKYGWVHRELIGGHIFINQEKPALLGLHNSVRLNSLGDCTEPPMVPDPRYHDSHTCVYDEFTDVWALGLILHQMVRRSGSKLDNPLDLPVKSFDLPKGVNWLVGFIIRACLSSDYHHRPSILQLTELLELAKKRDIAKVPIFLPAGKMLIEGVPRLHDLIGDDAKLKSLNLPDLRVSADHELVGQDKIPTADDLGMALNPEIRSPRPVRENSLRRGFSSSSNLMARLRKPNSALIREKFEVIDKNGAKINELFQPKPSRWEYHGTGEEDPEVNPQERIKEGGGDKSREYTITELPLESILKPRVLLEKRNLRQEPSEEGLSEVGRVEEQERLPDLSNNRHRPAGAQFVTFLYLLLLVGLVSLPLAVWVRARQSSSSSTPSESQDMQSELDQAAKVAPLRA